MIIITEKTGNSQKVHQQSIAKLTNAIFTPRRGKHLPIILLCDTKPSIL